MSGIGWAVAGWVRAGASLAGPAGLGGHCACQRLEPASCAATKFVVRYLSVSNFSWSCQRLEPASCAGCRVTQQVTIAEPLLAIAQRLNSRAAELSPAARQVTIAEPLSLLWRAQTCVEKLSPCAALQLVTARSRSQNLPCVSNLDPSALALFPPRRTEG